MRARLTPSQSDLYLADRGADDPTTYYVGLAYRIEGTLDETELRARFERLLAAHPMLTARVEESGDGWYLAPAERVPALHVSAVPLDADSPLAARRIRQECRRPMDLDHGPLLRAVLLRYPDQRADLVVVAHHLVVDEPSVELMARWLLTGEESEAAQSFSDWGTGTALTPERAARAAGLQDELTAADLAPGLDWATPPAGSDATGGALDELRLPAGLWEGARTLAADLRTSPYSLMTAAAALVLGRNSHAARPVLGATVSRRTPRHAAAVGYFNSTVPIPFDLDEQLTVADFLRAAHARSVRAYRDADLPLSAVLPKTAGGGPRLVVVPTTALPTLTTNTARCTPHPALDLGTAQFPLALYLQQDTDGLHGLLRYQRARVSASAAERFCRQVERAVAAFVVDPDQALGQAVTVLATDGPQPAEALEVADLSLPELFARHVATGPDRVAVSGGGVGVSYGELDAWSSLLAGVLAEAGVGVGDRVGVCLERGVELIVALLGVLKAGAVYVPLDASYPVERLGFVVEDTGVEVVVGDRLPAELAASVRVVDVHAQPTATDLVLPVIDPRSPAYVIHTSGSTGRPKGVLVSHRNVMALLAATRTEFALDAGDVWSFFHSFAFDFSVWEIWGCLLTGGRLVVVDHWSARDPEEFHALLAREQVTVLSQTPSAFSQLTRAETFTDPGQELAVRLLIFGGEPLDTATLLPWMDRYPPTRCRAVNMYGITETTVHCTWHTLTRADALTGSRSVGRPLPGWQLHLLDDQQRPLPLGTPGEIYVGGAGVSLGYHNRPELTAERFLPDPHNLGHTLYRTGDLGRYQDDGTLEHLGRLDDQVKIRGHRIEPAEIRTTLLDDTDVRAAAVVVRGAGTATARLDAYVVTAPDADPAQIKQRTAGRLPAHLVPATLTTVPELPLTTNGKLDTARLPDPLLTTPTPQTTPPSQTTVEARLAAVWEDVLGIPVGPQDNFFEIGGNSLLASRLRTALHQAGFTSVQLRDIYRNSSLPALADFVRAGHSGVKEPS